MKKILILTVMAAVLGSPAAASQNDAKAPAEDRATQRLLKEVRHELVMLPWYSVFDNLQYKVEGGTVTLMGQVSRPSLKKDAENAVKRIEGVEQVINNIEILPTSPNDDRLRRATYRAIFADGPLFRYAQAVVPSIHIIVKNGHITLEGVVANEGDKNFAGLKARGVPGAFSVTNNLQLENSSKK